MAAINLTDIVKTYDDGFTAVKGVSLDIADGEFMILVGPSGCGKSTLLRMIVGLEDITDGDLEIDGKRVNDIPPRDRNLSMVFQNYALYPHLTVAENIAFPLKLKKSKLSASEVKDRVQRAAEMLDLVDHLDRKPANLSGGQRQRVAMGRAIVREPEVFLFDEPLSNLDAALRVRMRYEFAALHQRLKTTMIYVTHDQVEAMTLADRIVVLNGGRIEQVGAPMELYEYPRNLFVAEFIGSPKMNLIAAQVTQASATGATVKTAGGETVTVAVDASAAKAGDTVTLGVRPEHLTLDGEGGALATTADFVETLGNATYAYVRHPGSPETLTVQLPGDVRPRAGDAMTLHVAPGQAHLFDADAAAFKRL